MPATLSEARLAYCWAIWVVSSEVITARPKAEDTRWAMLLTALARFTSAEGIPAIEVAMIGMNAMPMPMLRTHIQSTSVPRGVSGVTLRIR